MPKGESTVFLVNWLYHDQVWDSFEPPRSVLDHALIENFRADHAVNANLEQAVWELREAVAQESKIETA